MSATAEDYEKLAALVQQLTKHHTQLNVWLKQHQELGGIIKQHQDYTPQLEAEVRAQLIKVGLAPQTLASRMAAKVTGEFPEDKFTGPGYDAHPGYDHTDCCK